MLGILCGLESEAKIARRVEGAIVACSAARMEKAYASAQELVEKGATRLLSFGLAGGLKPGLTAGTIVIGTAVCAAGETRPCDFGMISSLRKALPEAQSGPVWTAETIITCASDKRALYHRSNCLSVDMESRAIALAAAKARIPFVVLRAIADTAEMDLPPAALVPLGYEGQVDLQKVLLTILRCPSQIFQLINLGANAFKGLKSLRTAQSRIFL